MINGKDTQNEASAVQGGPKVAKSNKRTSYFSARIIFAFLFCVALVITVVTLQTRFTNADDAPKEQERSYSAPQAAGFAELVEGIKRDRKQQVSVVTPQENKREPGAARRIVINAPRTALPSRYYSNKNDAQAANTLRTLKLQALTANPVVEDFELDKGGEAGTPQNGVAMPPNAMTGGAPSVMDSSMMAALMQQQQGQQQGQPDPNGQTGKIDFLRNGGGALTPQGYSNSLPVPQQFPYELKAGTLIPGIMLTGINSDLPGNVIAQVSENVWDTATGRYVLIPKGTRILGVYDSQVTFGQRRVLLVWNRLIFPNGTTLDIAGSPGVDQGGYSGLSGKVNEHWGTMIKSALLASVFVAGAEIVYDNDSQGIGNENKSPRDVAAESTAGAILDMGTKVMGKASDLQPTITIRPGKRMGIFVQRDVVFPFPYF